MLIANPSQFIVLFLYYFLERLVGCLELLQFLVAKLGLLRLLQVVILNVLDVVELML